MTWVFMSLRIMSLKTRISQFQKRDLNISQRIQDLQRYASNIADGKITYNEMAQCPSSVFGTQMNFLAASSPIAYQSAQVKTNAYLQQMAALQQSSGGQYQMAIDPSGSGQYLQNNSVQPYLLFNEIYQQELKAYADEMAEQLNQEEEELQQEKITVETQMKAAEAELESLQKQLDTNIKNDAIQLA